MTLVIMGILLNFTSFLCTTFNSALTTSIVGVVKGVLVTLVGYFSFGGMKFDPINVSGEYIFIIIIYIIII